MEKIIMANVTYFETDYPEFESKAKQNGTLYWWASDFMIWLGYESYSPVMKPIQKALQVCMSSNIDTNEAFKEEYREINGKRIKDFKISRFACYLVAMNADLKKPNVTKAQTYLAGLASTFQEYIESQQDLERVSLRSEISDHEKSLSSTAKRHGVQNYAFFQNRGYMGLYNMPLKKIKELKNIPEKKVFFDFMGSEELGANIFRVTQTEAKIKRENIKGQDALEQAAQEVGASVRQAIKDMGGTLPENLSPRTDISKIRGDLKKTNKIFRKNDEIKKLDEDEK